ncbi:MAG: DNA alkylation repair protein [Lewinellaceae bacterium]|nr:DNA alkylation repair protein [Lewinellaceae bacterium]
MEEYYRLVRDQFRQHGNPEIAQGQMRYMKYQFEYFGLKAPQWMAHTKQIHAHLGIPEGEDLKTLVRLCFADDHRELHYFALETVQKVIKKQDPDFINFLEELIRTKSWWDTVDWIASKMVGTHFLRFPDQIRPITTDWMDSGYIWLQRTSIIFQLKYKEKTDYQLMFDYILRIADTKEFFLQKGAGWALRQYSRTNPKVVREFIEQHRLPALTRREGLRLMQPK